MATTLHKILLDWSAGKGKLTGLESSISNRSIKTLTEVKALLQALQHLVELVKYHRYQISDYRSDSSLYIFASLLQSMDFDQLRQADGDLYDEVYSIVNSLADACEAIVAERLADSGLPFACKVLAVWNHPRNPKFIAKIATEDRLNDDFLWEIVFQSYFNNIVERVAEQREVAWDIVDLLREPLPRQFMGVAYLDFTNALAIQDLQPAHPFNCVAGIARLRSWLSDADLENASYARSATAALPFIDRPERDELLTIARNHSQSRVRLEAAWVSAKSGDAAGIAQLQEFANDPNYAKVAQSYLSEFAVAAAQPEPNFQAQAEMAEWLAHPHEFGRLPDRLELYDTRTIYWPPTDDRRTVWLFSYTYQDSDQSGLGMVGSVTFALFGETTAAITPVEAYALHCCWELEISQDPRTPSPRSVAAGLAILKQYNPNL